MTSFKYVLEPPARAYGFGPDVSWTETWAELSRLCRAYPNLWFVAEDIPNSASAHIKDGKPARFFGPAGTFEATMRDCYRSSSGQMVGTLYVRYVG